MWQPGVVAPQSTATSEPFRVLLVCTANICRSPAAARLLHALLGAELGAALEVGSAGTRAPAGSAACDLSSALVGGFLSRTYGGDGPMATDTHRARGLTAALAQDSDLILTADRHHRAAVARIAPQTRARTFTLRHAALLAQPIGALAAGGTSPEGAPPLPDEPAARSRWFVAEMDAARGLGGAAPTTGVSTLSWHPYDVPDPHVVGYQVHPIALELIEDATVTLCDAFDAILTLPLAEQTPSTTYD